jgi:hypothetical protein
MVLVPAKRFNGALKEQNRQTEYDDPDGAFATVGPDFGQCPGAGVIPRRQRLWRRDRRITEIKARRA